MTPYLISGALTAGLAIGGYTGWSLKQGEWDASIVAAQTERGDVLREVALNLAKSEARQQVIKERVIRETVKEPVYVECAHSGGVLDSINAALTGSAPASDVPPAHAP